MIKYLTPMILCTPVILCTSVNAIELDIGIGYTQFHSPSNGIWYQREFDYEFDLKSASYRLGARFNPWENIYVTAGYQHLGEYDTWALATGGDDKYHDWVSRGGEVDELDLSTWIGEGEAHGLYTMAEYHWNNFYITGGVWAHKASWKMTIPDFRRMGEGDPYPLVVRSDEPLEYGRIIGVGYKYKQFSISYEVWEVKARTAFYPATRGDAQHLNFTYTFGGNN